MDQVCCHGNEQDRYARKDVQDRSVGYREDMHHNDSNEAKNNEKIIFKLNDDCLLRLSSHWSRGIFHMPGISLSDQSNDILAKYVSCTYLGRKLLPNDPPCLNYFLVS